MAQVYPNHSKEKINYLIETCGLDIILKENQVVNGLLTQSKQ